MLTLLTGAGTAIGPGITAAPPIDITMTGCDYMSCWNIASYCFWISFRSFFPSSVQAQNIALMLCANYPRIAKEIAMNSVAIRNTTPKNTSGINPISPVTPRSVDPVIRSTRPIPNVIGHAIALHVMHAGENREYR